MNRIYWDKDKIGMLTDCLDAAEHRHWMMQLFLCLEDSLNICVAGEDIFCKCIVVQKNLLHSFSADKKLHFSALIEPASSLAEQLSQKMNGRNYLCFDGIDDTQVQKAAIEMSENADIGLYIQFTRKLYDFLNIKEQSTIYDTRIKDFLQLIDSCDCAEHTISSFVKKIALSPSRLSHLFREQVGIPIKSYILLHQMKCAFSVLSSGKTITEAALLAGFDSPSHFAATVKKMMGLPASLSLKDSEFLKVSVR